MDKVTEERFGFFLEKFLADDPRLKFKQVARLFGVRDLDSLDRQVPDKA
jgi:hypothetical protein